SDVRHRVQAQDSNVNWCDRRSNSGLTCYFCFERICARCFTRDVSKCNLTILIRCELKLLHRCASAKCVRGHCKSWNSADGLIIIVNITLWRCALLSLCAAKYPTMNTRRVVRPVMTCL